MDLFVVFSLVLLGLLVLLFVLSLVKLHRRRRVVLEANPFEGFEDIAYLEDICEEDFSEDNCFGDEELSIAESNALIDEEELYNDIDEEATCLDLDDLDQTVENDSDIILEDENGLPLNSLVPNIPELPPPPPEPTIRETSYPEPNYSAPDYGSSGGYDGGSSDCGDSCDCGGGCD